MAKNKDTMSRVSISGILGTTVVGTLSKSTGQGAGISSDYSKGVGRVGGVMPTYGKVVGTKMVLKPLRKLRKKSFKFMKGGRRL